MGTIPNLGDHPWSFDLFLGGACRGSLGRLLLYGVGMSTQTNRELTREEKIEVLVGEQLRHAQMDGSYLPDFFRAYFVRYDDWQIDKMYQYAKEDAQ